MAEFVSPGFVSDGFVGEAAGSGGGDAFNDTAADPLGAFPLGGFSGATLSIADPLPGLISDSELKREFLLRSSPGGTDVDLSSSGYNSLPTDTPYQAFPAAISRIYNFSVGLPVPDLSGGAQVGAGEIILKNPDGSLDATAQLDWLGAATDAYIGRKDESLSNFTRFSSGTTSGASWDLNSIQLLVKDLRFRLKNRLQLGRYGGFGAQLNFDGNDFAVGSGPVSCPAGLVTIEARVTLTANNTSGIVCNYRNGASAGLRQISIGDSGTNIPRFYVRNDAGVLFSVTSNSALEVGTPVRVSCVLDTSLNQIRIYLDGDLSSTPVSVSGTFNTTTTNFGVGRLADLSSNFLTGRLDDIRVWPIVRSQAQIKSTMSRELFDSEVGSVSHYWKFNEGSGSTVSDYAGAPLTITGATWVGSLEGDSSLANTPKPVLVGVRSQISPKLVDSQRLVYQIHHGGAVDAITDVLDSGDSLTFGSDVSDIYASTPAAGTYNTCLAKGLFRLGSSPIGEITVWARGHVSPTLGYVDTLADIQRVVLTEFGLQPLSDSDLNLNTFSGLNSKTTAAIGFYFDSEINVDSALDYISKSGGSGWWAPDRVAKISVGRIDDPSTLAAEVTLTATDLVESSRGGRYRRTPIGVRVGTVILGYRRYNTTLTSDQIAGVVGLATRDDLGKEYRFVTATDPNASADADTMTVYTEIYNESDAQAEADRLLDLWSIDRGSYEVTLKSGLLSYFIGTVFEVVVDRYDTTGGKKFIAYRLTETMGEYRSTDRLEPDLFG